jgi:hypothetical protein
MAAMTDIKNLEMQKKLQDKLQTAANINALDQQKDRAVSLCFPQFDVIIKSFIALLQMEADKSTDKVISDPTYLGIPKTLIFDNNTLDVSIYLQNDKNFAYKIRVSAGPDEVGLFIISNLSYSITDKPLFVSFQFQHDDTKSLWIRENVNGLDLPLAKTTIQDARAINTALSYLIAGQYDKLGITPPSSTPDKSASPP